MIKTKLLSVFLLFAFVGCKIKTNRVIDLRERANALFDKISNGNAEKEFPIKYFPPEQTRNLMYDLKNKCDFRNRQGHFLNEYYSDDRSKVSLLYEFYLKCDSIRFILTYNLSDTIELYEFKMEPHRKRQSYDNSQINVVPLILQS